MFESEKAEAEWVLVHPCVWCTRPGGVDESENLSPKLNHQHVPAEGPEWLFARAVFGMLCI